MPAPKHRSRTLRRVFVKTPGGKTKLTYRKRKPSKAKCAGCGAILRGVTRVRANRLKGVSKTKKSPSRPFGGKLCTKCSRKKLIEKIK